MRKRSLVLFGLLVLLAVLQFMHAFFYQPSRINFEEQKLVKSLGAQGVVLPSPDSVKTLAYFLQRMRAMWVDDQIFALLLLLLALTWFALEKREARRQKDNLSSN